MRNLRLLITSCETSPHYHVNVEKAAIYRAFIKKNMASAEAKRKSLISGGTFELADYIKKKIGAVGSGITILGALLYALAKQKYK